MNVKQAITAVRAAEILQDLRWDAEEDYDMLSLATGMAASPLFSDEAREDPGWKVRKRKQLSKLVKLFRDVQQFEEKIQKSGNKLKSWKSRKEIQKFLLAQGISTFELPQPMPKKPSCSYDERLMRDMHIKWD
jgi:hypothetical protein